MRIIKIVLGCVHCLLFAVSGYVQAEIFHWVDSEGKRHFGDRPPSEYKADRVEVIENTVKSRVVMKNPDDAGVTNKSADGPKSVIMYSAAWCGICKQAARYFKKNKIPFEEYDIDKSGKGRRDYEKLNGRGVPIILVGKQRMNGFSPDRFQALYAQK